MSTHFMNLLDGLQRRSLRMASAVEDMLEEACEAAMKTDHVLAQRVIARDQEIDAEEVEVESEVIHLITLFQPMAADMRLLCTVLKVNSDLERVADCAVNIAERARHLDPQRGVDQNVDLMQIISIVRQHLRNAVEAYSTGDAAAAQKIPRDDDAVDAFYGQFIRKLAAEAAQSPERMAAHLDVLSIAKNLERVADHATNIAEDVVFLSTGEIVRHRNA
jgi:phosphate transport system protein